MTDDRMRKRRSMGSFRFGRDVDEFADAQQAATLKNERRSSLRSFSGSMRSLFGREDDYADANANPLSDFQQQSLSVFESEHMWAHFKAHLADNKIQTAAGVRAMLPEFVNDRVLDGSVRSDRPVYPACTQSQLGANPLSVDVSERCNSIDYSQTLRGDAGHVLSLHDSVNTEAQKSSDAKGLGKVIPACLSIDNSKRSVLSSLGWNEDHSMDISDNKKSSDHTASLTLDLSSRLSLDLSSRRSLDLSSQRRSLDLSARRANFLSTLGKTKEVALENDKKSGNESGPRRPMFKSSSCRPKFVRPVESTDRSIKDIIERHSGHGSNETLDEGDKDTFGSKPFSYRPSRSLSAPPDFRKVRRASLSSRVSSDTSTLLVEWGENDELSSDDEEKDENSSGNLNDSERALVMSMNGGLVVDWNDNADDDDSVVSDDLDRGIFADNSR